MELGLSLAINICSKILFVRLHRAGGSRHLGFALQVSYLHGFNYMVAIRVDIFGLLEMVLRRITAKHLKRNK